MNPKYGTTICQPAESLPASNRDDNITRVMRLSEKPGVISFAGGFPAPEVQRWRALSRLTAKALDSHAFGYGPTPGNSELRTLLAGHMQARGRDTVADEVLITAGGIAGLDLLAATCLEAGDRVVVGSPAYLGALQVFRNHGARMTSIRVSDQGLDLKRLELALAGAQGQHKPIKYIYTVPSFDNPTGATAGFAWRRQLIRLATEYGAWIVEDGAYQELYFKSPPASMLAALAPERVIHINTFSKTLCPGFRLGWMTAPAPLIARLSHRKQGWDQCASTVGQRVALAALRTGYLDKQLELARVHYLCRRDRMIDSLMRELGDAASWNIPAGGFYIWMRLPAGISAERVAATALADSGVAVLPGACFYADDPEPETVRLCFSCVDRDRIEKGVKGLSRAVARHMGPELRSMAI